MPTALFGIKDGSLNLAVNLLILCCVVVWMSLIYWTYLDAKRRITDPFLVAAATAASLFPFIGTIVYTILRPPEFLEDARERELEIKASELRLRQPERDHRVPRCEHPIEHTWLRCPECQHRLKDPCRSCGQPVDPRWAVCPYCETPSLAASSSPSRAPRGSARAGPQTRQLELGARAPSAQRRAPRQLRAPTRVKPPKRASGAVPPRRADPAPRAHRAPATPRATPGAAQEVAGGAGRRDVGERAPGLGHAPQDHAEELRPVSHSR